MTTSADDSAILTLAELRRAIFARVSARLEARGTPIDTTPDFLALVDRWVNAEISMADVTRGYSEVRRAARGKRSLQMPPAERIADPRMSQEKLLAELENIIGIHELDQQSPT